MLNYLCEFAEKNANVQNEPATAAIHRLLEMKQPALVAQEIVHCSARLGAKETHTIVELRLHSASSLYGFFAWFRLCLCAAGGEILGQKPLPNWARKARGQQQG